MIEMNLTDKELKDLDFIRRHHGLSKNDEVIRFLIKKEIYRLSGGEPTYEIIEIDKSFFEK